MAGKGIFFSGRDNETLGDLRKNFENKSLPAVVSQENVKNNEVLSKINKDENLKKTYDYAKSLGLNYNQFGNSTKVVYDDGTGLTFKRIDVQAALNDMCSCGTAVAGLCGASGGCEEGEYSSETKEL